MDEQSNKSSLALRSLSSEVSTMATGKRLFDRMNEDLLVTIDVTRQDLAPVMRRLGKYELCEEDYQQLHNWARDFAEVATALELANELARRDCCIDGGRIKDLIFIGFPRSIEWLEFSNVPELTRLSIIMPCENQLTGLDLSHLPKLKRLNCYGTSLTELDLSNVPQLQELSFKYCKLTGLDLSKVPALNSLSCESNLLTELDLSNVPRLWDLCCYENQLAKLDIRKCVELKYVFCDQLTKIIKNPDQIIEVTRNNG